MMIRTLHAVKETFFYAAVITCMVPAASHAVEPVGIAQLQAFERLPFLKDGVTAGSYESTDKTGENIDRGAYIYQEGNKYVLFDVQGPGCIYNCWGITTGTWEFYFDGEASPRFTINQDQWGTKAPFLQPLARIRGDCRFSNVPMPFKKSCRVLSASSPDWHHVLYQTYVTDEGVTTFTGNEDYAAVRNMWNNVGTDPKSASGNVAVTGTVSIPAGASATLFNRTGKESIASIKMTVNPNSQQVLNTTWIKAAWDGEANPSVNCPIGMFFGGEFGDEPLCKLLTHGMRSSDGKYYNYFPMPYWQSARITITNNGSTAISSLAYEIQYKPSGAFDYPKDKCGYFRTTYSSPSTPATGVDHINGVVSGRGHMVSGLITAYTNPGDVRGVEEGDVRFRWDNSQTTQILGTGAEDYILFCMGFGPVEFYQINGHSGNWWPYSLVRSHLSDWIPFQTAFRFTNEHGGWYSMNDLPMEESGGMFYYGSDNVVLVATDSMDVGNTASETAHSYTTQPGTSVISLSSYYEGEYKGISVTDNGRSFSGYSQFTVSILPGNNGIRLRRRMDDSNGRQKANVYIDNQLVTQRPWYTADVNAALKWMDDDFEVPASYTAGKSRITVKIEYVSSSKGSWNEYYYHVYTYSTATVSNKSAIPRRLGINQQPRLLINKNGAATIDRGSLHGVISFFSAAGQRMFTSTESGGVVRMQVAPGAYFITFKNGAGNTLARREIIR